MNVFVCMVPIHYYLFRSVYAALEDSVFIIPPMPDKTIGKYGGGMSGKGMHDFLNDFLRRKQGNTADYGEINLKNFVSFLSGKGNNIFCPHIFEGIYEIENARIFKMVYGIPNSLNNQFSYSDNFIMDAIFTFGPESRARFNSFGLSAKEVGNPLFDDWFSEKMECENYSILAKRIDKTKQTILYLPTHDQYSSFDQFAESIIDLARDYNVIIKVHHMTFNGEMDRLCKLLSHPEIITLGDYFDPLPLYKVSDIILSDTSGALFDSILLQKPTLMLNCSLPYKVDILEKHNNNGTSRGIVPYVENPTQLTKLIRENIGKPVQNDEKLMYELYYLRDGKAGQRIAEIVNDSSSIPTIPLIEKYETAIKNSPNVEERLCIIGRRDYFLRKKIKPTQKSMKQKFKDILKAI